MAGAKRSRAATSAAVRCDRRAGFLGRSRWRAAVDAAVGGETAGNRTEHARRRQHEAFGDDRRADGREPVGDVVPAVSPRNAGPGQRSEEHTSELQSLMRISYAVFCLKKKKKTQN